MDYEVDDILWDEEGFWGENVYNSSFTKINKNEVI